MNIKVKIQCDICCDKGYTKNPASTQYIACPFCVNGDRFKRQFPPAANQLHMEAQRLEALIALKGNSQDPELVYLLLKATEIIEALIVNNASHAIVKRGEKTMKLLTAKAAELQTTKEEIKQ